MHVLFGRRFFTPFLSADGGAPEGGAAAADNKDDKGAASTTEDVAAQIEAAKEAGRAEARVAYEAELAQKLEEGKTEAAKLAQMNADEKAEYERKQREEALAKREADIASRELRAETIKTLADKGLPADVLDLVIGADAADTAKRIDNFKGQFDKAVQAGVEARLKGKTPTTGSGAAQSPDDQARAAFSTALKGGF